MQVDLPIHQKLNGTRSQHTPYQILKLRGPRFLGSNKKLLGRFVFLGDDGDGHHPHGDEKPGP